VGVAVVIGAEVVAALVVVVEAGALVVSDLPNKLVAGPLVAGVSAGLPNRLVVLVVGASAGLPNKLAVLVLVTGVSAGLPNRLVVLVVDASAGLPD
jgi:hypothetical protein